MTASSDRSGSTDTRPLRILVYSDDRNTRDQVRFAIGKRPDAELPAVEFHETATQYAVLKALDAGEADLAILDGEAVPAGGMGLCRQLKDEIYRCPPVLVLIGRAQDAWLATWSRADAVQAHPIDPITLVEAVVELARRRLAVQKAG